MIKSKIKQSHSTAWGYVFMGLPWIGMLIVLVAIATRHYGIEQPIEILKALQAAADTIIYLLVVFSVNIIMAISVWRIISFSKRTQHIVVVFAIFLAISSAILLIATIASWFIKKMPDWYSPLYNVYPAAFFTFGYGYLAYDLRKILRISNNAIETDRE